MNSPTAISKKELSQRIHSRAREMGFALCGITPAVTPTGFSHLEEWVGKSFEGEMKYIPDRMEAYADPGRVLPGVKSIIMLASNYSRDRHPELETNEGRVSRYSWSDLDYHDVLRRKLKEFSSFLHECDPNCKTRGVVDTAPLLERDFAKQAGLGWFGKNTMLINKFEGSWFFLSGILTDMELEYDAPHESSHCGTCTRCLDICPTDAFEDPYVLDSRKCISYLTIELKNPIPVELRHGISDWLFGCDLCQDVCPWNRKLDETPISFFETESPLNKLNASDLLMMDERDFDDHFRKTPLSRPRRAGILRNAAIVLGNLGDHSSVPSLIHGLNDQEPLVRGASAWALGQIATEESLNSLREREQIENSPVVLDEISWALKTSHQ